MKGYIFDTNIFNDILDLDQKINIETLSKFSCFVTHIQHDEIQKTNDNTRKAQLNKVFSSLSKEEIPTASIVLDISCVGKANLSNGEQFKKMLERLNCKNKNNPNNQEDILIAETAFKNRLTLVTHDDDLYSVMTKCRGASCNLYHLLYTG